MNERDERPLVAVTLGDPGGIGPEVTLEALAPQGHDPQGASDAEIRARVRPLLVGSAAVLRRHAEALGKGCLRIRAVEAVPETFPEDEVLVLDVAEEGAPAFAFGQVTEAGGRLSMRAVARAVDLCTGGAAGAMVTAPISKEAIGKAGYRAPGHTEFIAERVGEAEPLMLMVGTPVGGEHSLRVGLVSVHEPLRDAPRSVTPGAIRRKLRILAASLRRDFGVEAPRIAVLGLNPHAGDGGKLGREEQEIIAPALEAARAEDDLAAPGARIDGPVPADGFFGTRAYRRYDAVLAMYHDQGLAPFKALTFGRGVNMTAGLPVVRTSPDHGTAFDIAGQGTADPGSMKSALRLAAAVAQRRRTADDGRQKPA